MRHRNLTVDLARRMAFGMNDGHVCRAEMRIRPNQILGRCPRGDLSGGISDEKINVEACVQWKSINHHNDGPLSFKVVNAHAPRHLKRNVAKGVSDIGRSLLESPRHAVDRGVRGGVVL